MTELIFEVVEDAESGLRASAIGYPIHTFGNDEAELRAMTFVGTWKDQEMVRVQLTRADYTALKLAEIDERIGQHHGRVFLELATNRKSDEKAAKENAARIAKEYKAEDLLEAIVKAGQ